MEFPGSGGGEGEVVGAEEGFKKRNVQGDICWERLGEMPVIFFLRRMYRTSFFSHKRSNVLQKKKNTSNLTRSGMSSCTFLSEITIVLPHINRGKFLS